MLHEILNEIWEVEGILYEMFGGMLSEYGMK